MEVNYLRYFFEVAQSGSFTAAARRLRVSQSALSKAVALLEEREGVKLLQRSKRGVALTPIGEIVYLKSEKVFQMLTDIELSCRGAVETCEGPLRIGTSDHVANYLLVKTVRRMREAHPKVLPSLFAGTPNDIAAKILANEIEFGLFFTKVNMSGVVYEPLFDVPMAVVCHPDLASTLMSARGQKLKEAFRRIGLIGSIRAQYQLHPSKELMDVIGADLPIILETNSQESQKRLCLERCGIAYLARFMVESELASGALVEIQMKRPIVAPLHLARRRGRELPLPARTFLEFLRAGSSALG